MQQTQGKDDNIIRIGEKPIEKYIRAVQQKVNDGVSKIGISARGKFISTAFNVAHSRDFENVLEVEKIESKSETSEREENGQKRESRFTSVTIHMKRK